LLVETRTTWTQPGPGQAETINDCWQCVASSGMRRLAKVVVVHYILSFCENLKVKHTIRAGIGIGWVHTEEADHSSLMIKRMNCELTRLLRQQTSTQPGPTTSHETALGRTARASALVGRFAWSKTQEEDELVEVPNEDSEAVAAVLVVIRRDCGLLVLNRLIHNSVSLRKAPEGIGYR